MSCTPLNFDGPSGITEVLRGVDCGMKQATAFAFERFFGAHGALSLALTAVLTLYIALLALNLLTGRTALRLSLLTPRALTLGLVLTFASSWVAYQQVVWNLAVGAPDEVARLVIGSQGSATEFFAGQLDRMFSTVADAAGASSAASAPASDAAKKSAGLSPSDLLWFSGLLLLLGTAGVLIVAKITLAALLAIGPLFMVLALFGATRGLFEGWLKSVALFALVPLVTVLVGAGGLMLLSPMVQALSAAGGAPSMRLAVGLLLASCIYTALMAISLKAAASLTSGWRLPRAAGEGQGGDSRPALPPQPLGPAAAAAPGLPGAGHAHEAGRDERVRQLVAASYRPPAAAAAHGAAPQSRAVQLVSAMPVPAASAAGERTRHLGARAQTSSPFKDNKTP
jgi:type IV secretion system protein VirB6